VLEVVNNVGERVLPLLLGTASLEQKTKMLKMLEAVVSYCQVAFGAITYGLQLRPSTVKNR
jgi:hypothetical protein